jgi:hypothetical protein
MPLPEADTCRRYVTKKLYEAGWTGDHISEQKSFTDGRTVTAGLRQIPATAPEFGISAAPPFGRMGRSQDMDAPSDIQSLAWMRFG